MRPREEWREKSVGVSAMLVLGGGLLALFLGVSWFWAIWVLGFAVVVPILAILLDVEEETWWEAESTESATRERSDPLQTIRDRYARGELTEEQLERKLEHLLETEQLEDVEDRLREPE